MSFNFRSKPNIVFILAVVGLAAMGWFSLRESRMQAESNRRVSETRDVLEKSASLRSHLMDVGAASRSYQREADPKTLAAIDTAVQLTQSDFASLQQRTVDNPEQRSRLLMLEPLLRARLDFLKTSASKPQGASRNAATADATAAQQAALSMQMTDQIHQFDAVEQQLLTQRSLEAETSNAVAAQSGLVLSISVCLLAVLALVPFNIELARRGRAERAVTEQKKLLESILNSCKDAVVVSDRSGKVILRNPAAQGQLPTPPPDDAKPQDIPRLLGFYKPDGVTLYNFEELGLARALRGETVEALEICVRHPNKAEPQWWLETGSPLINDQGEQSGGVVFLRDITERRQVRVQLKAALQESEARARENKELTKLTDLLQSCQTIEEACGIAENALSTIFGEQPGGLFLTNSSRNLLEAGGIWNHCSTTEQVFAPDDCWALRLGKPYVSANLAPPLRCSHLSGTPAKHCVCVPLTAQGETLGVLYVEDHAAPSGSGGEQERLERHAIAVAERLSLALSNLKLREVLRNQSIRDPLTGLFNRRYLEESMVREAHRSTRRERSFSVVMMDLDHYKRFNDTFGHPAGDQLLREIGSLLKARIRAGDVACRYGGEEFALILSEVDTKGAERCVDILRQEIKQLPANHAGQGLSSVTISAGIAEFPLHGDTPEELIRAADTALYQAKRNGRDRVAVCESHLPNPTV